MIPSKDATAPIRLADYRAPRWRVGDVELEFELDSEHTEVDATLHLQPASDDVAPTLRLDGEELELLAIELDGRPLPATRYRIDAQGMTLYGLERACVLRTRVRIHPERNTRLEGLYASGDSLFTQCEAEGFRRITYFIDRPDVSTRYRVTLRADRARFPVLLSNGNPDGAGELEHGRHWARWNDPHPKPCYLFALVAGQLECVQSSFVTAEGRAVEVRVWAAAADVARCDHALQSALRAMRWDEERFGRVYDLDQFNIVAAQDFTMGAMENKGLNIFNARYILADAETATDSDFEGVESVIGHEYFHNWSGNRVTLRDWFQLSLKEGLTVFRDQEFTSDLHSRALKRIDDVRLLKSRQFVEDSGPLAHPVRPREYSEINNFYTATVYEKGAEVVRMLHTLLGEKAFRAGLDAYFARHDGGAATIEDFLAAMSAASGRDLSQFARWYDQAGTPALRIEDDFDAASGEYRLQFEQYLPQDPDAPPLHVPLAYALFDADDRRLSPPASGDATITDGMIELTASRHSIRFSGLAAKPLPAFLQGLSAPVRLQFNHAPEELARLVVCEPDPLTRWEAVQQLASDVILRRGDDPDASRAALVDALGLLLEDASLDPAFVAECHRLPDLATLSDHGGQIDLDALLREREDLLDLLAEAHADRFDARYHQCSEQARDSVDGIAIGLRRLRSVCLARLTRLDPTARLASAQYAQSRMLTDRLAALTALVHHDAPDAGAALAQFRERFSDDPLVTDKWLGIVLTRPQPDTLDTLDALLAGPLWRPSNPNRVRAIVGSFARGNPVAFHRRDGAGYERFFALLPVLDGINPQVASRQLTVLENWCRLDPPRRALLGDALRALQAQSLSRDCADVVQRLLQD